MVYATGAMRDRRMGIPGEDLRERRGHRLRQLVFGRPTSTPASTPGRESVAVIGVGNVAVDIARILIRDPDDLRETDISQPVLETLMSSKVREVHMIGRRGPAQAKFTTRSFASSAS